MRVSQEKGLVSPLTFCSCHTTHRILLERRPLFRMDDKSSHSSCLWTVEILLGITKRVNKQLPLPASRKTSRYFNYGIIRRALRIYEAGACGYDFILFADSVDPSSVGMWRCAKTETPQPSLQSRTVPKTDR